MAPLLQIVPERLKPCRYAMRTFCGLFKVRNAHPTEIYPTSQLKNYSGRLAVISAISLRT